MVTGSNTAAVERFSRVGGERLAGELVDHVEGPHLTAIGGDIVLEVQGPHLIGPGGLEPVATLGTDPTLLHTLLRTLEAIPPRHNRLVRFLFTIMPSAQTMA